MRSSRKLRFNWRKSNFDGMEKPSNFKSKIMSCLPKATSPVTFQLSPPASPVKASARKGFNAPTISIIPKEIRRKPKTESFIAQEPTSPKVSCMGQVVNVNKKKNMSKPKRLVPPIAEPTPTSSPIELKKKHLSTMSNILEGTKQGGKMKINDNKKPKVAERIPSLGQMKQYASSRGMLANFDWTACEEEATVAIEPRKEVNLWKRRNRAPPIPLQV